MHSRIHVLKWFCLALSILYPLRCIYIYIFQNEKLSALAVKQFHTTLRPVPLRSTITDRNGQPLALSLKVRSLYAQPRLFVKKKDAIQAARTLSRALGVSYSDLLEKLTSGKNFVWLQRKLSEEQEVTVKKLELGRLKHVLGFVEEGSRIYPMHSRAAHVLGGVNIDGYGIEGIENKYDEDLITTSDPTRVFRDAKGRSILNKGWESIPREFNKELFPLTLDASLQYHVEQTILAYRQKFKATKASAIVMDVRTGEILAFANDPSYDPNEIHRTSLKVRRDFLIHDPYEPGSVFKPFIVAAALESGWPANTHINCENGQFKVADRIISEAETHEKFGNLSLGDILKHSSNIGAAKIALKLGPDKIKTYLDIFRINKKTSLGLPGESSGQTRSLQDFLESLRSQVTLANIGFGQGLTMTAIQLTSLYQALANGGVWIQPHLSSLDETTQIKMMSKATAHKVVSMLEGVLSEGGTGTKANLTWWKAAGKTGTAQKIDPITKKYSRSLYISSFFGLAPSENPRYVVGVILDEPKTAYYAGDVAAPAFKDIMEFVLTKYKIPISPSLAKSHILTQSSVQKESNVTSNELNDSIQQHQMPKLIGAPLKEAIEALYPHYKAIYIQGSGTVFQQWPTPGTPLQADSKIKLRCKM